MYARLMSVARKRVCFNPKSNINMEGRKKRLRNVKKGQRFFAAFTISKIVEPTANFHNIFLVPKIFKLQKLAHVKCLKIDTSPC